MNRKLDIFLWTAVPLLVFAALFAFTRVQTNNESQVANNFTYLQNAFDVNMLGTQGISNALASPVALRGKVIVIDNLGDIPPGRVFGQRLGIISDNSDALAKLTKQLDGKPEPIVRSWNELREWFEEKQRASVSVLSLRLPEGMIALTPYEVRTVVLVDCKRKIEGYYAGDAVGTGTAYSLECEVSVVDRNNHFIWRQQEKFQGSQPPKWYTVPLRGVATDQYGDMPYSKIEKYLLGLPRFRD